jgi:gliding motility-associated-like protein
LFAVAQNNTDTICGGRDTVHFAVNGSIGSTYNWNVNGGTILSGVGTEDIAVTWGQSSGLINISVIETDSNGCQGDLVQTSVFVQEADLAFIDGPDELCLNEEVWLQAYAGDDFAWNNGDTAKWINFTLRNDTILYLVAFNKDCPNDTFYHKVSVIAQPEADMSEIGDTLTINTALNLEYTGMNAAYIEWHVNDAYSGEGVGHFYQFTQPGEHEITQVAHSGDCSDTIKRKTYVRDDFAVHIPNSFTPNGDGLNDVFEFYGTGIKEYQAIVMNRWGEEMHFWTHSDANSYWDGTSKGEPVTSGVYVYRIVVVDYHNVSHNFTGNITILR